MFSNLHPHSSTYSPILYSLPFVSGNVSFYNESIKTAVPPTPEILGIGIVSDIRNCITVDFKKENNPLYLVGKKTEKEMGGSEYYKILDVDGGVVPRSDIGLLKNCMNGILSAIEQQLIASCHDVSEGGLAVCLSEMIIGGDLGAAVDVSEIAPDLRTDFKLFSESNTRWVVEVNKEKQQDFEKTLKRENTSFQLIGETKGKKLVIQNDEKTVIDLAIDVLRYQWKSPLWNVMG